MKTISKIIIPLIVVIIISVTYVIFLDSHDNEDQDTIFPFIIKLEETFGGVNEDEGWFVLSTSDGGCILTGYTKSYGLGNQDLWLIKINNNGKEEWSQTYGGDGDETGKCIQQTEDGGYIVVGTSTSFSSEDYDKDVFLIKVDEEGNKEWQQTYGGLDSDEGYSIEKTNEGGYLITGVTSSYSAGEPDAWLINVDVSGIEQWNKSFGGNKYDEGRSIIKTADGGFVIAGRTGSYANGETDAWLFKVDEMGNQQWSKVFGSENYDIFNQVIQTDDGGFIVTGHSQVEYPNGWYGFIVKTDDEGFKQWEKTFLDDNITGTSSIEEVEDGFVAVGYIGEYGSDQELYIVKLDFDGKVVGMDIIERENLSAAVWVDKLNNRELFITGYYDVSGTGKNDLWLLKIEIT